MQITEYKEYITTNGFVKDKYADYYVNWVRYFLKLEVSEKLTERERVAQFRRLLQNDGKREEWQVAQAVHAVELYLNLFLKRREERIAVANNLPDASDLLAKFTEMIRLKHYSLRTEETYRDWIRRYVEYCVVESLEHAESSTVKRYLTYLATRKNVAASTQNQAFNALLFLFRFVLEKPLDDIKGTVRAKNRRKIPVVLSVDEIIRLFNQVEGTRRMIFELIYGCGLRISELIRLRVQDIDFENGVLRVIDAKGGKDRGLPLPRKLIPRLKEHLKKVKKLHESDLAIGCGEVYLPPSVSNKNPGAAKEWKWQYVFPSKSLSVDPRSGARRRHHILEKSIQTTMKKAVEAAGIAKSATVHTLRHSYATHLLMSGVNIREIQELLGHKNVETTMIYTHVVSGLMEMPRSPLDMLDE